MTDRDERRSRVPAGTFGSSEPPATPADAEAALGDEPANPRRRFARTLSGEEPVVDDDDRPSSPERTKAQVTTLLGHPPTPASQTLPGGASPILSPPKWRGASAYSEGEEPQPRVSGIPAPPPMAAAPAGPAPTKPVGVPIGVMRSTVKTKVGQPPPAAPVRPPPAPRPLGAPPTVADEALLKDAVQPADETLTNTIQQMLEQQASVPIQVDEGIPELAIDELIDDEPSATRLEPIVDDDSETERPPPEQPPAAAREPAEPAEPAEPIAAEAVEQPSEPAPSPAAAPSKPKPAAAAPAAAPKSTEAARPAPEARRWAERRPQEATSPEAAIPVLIGRAIVRSVTRLDRDARMGLLFVAAMVVVGGGGWVATLGTYQPPRLVKPVAAAAAPSDAAPADTAKTEPAPTKAEGAPATPAPAAAPTTAVGPAAAAPKDPAVQREPARRADPTEAAPSAEPSAPAATEPTSVLTVTPRGDDGAHAGELPDSPTRENVIATLNGLRPSFLECAQGQRGVAQLDITLIDSGAVSHVVVGGDFAGSTQGTCIARAARAAQFAPFKKPRFRLVYPISL